MVQIPDEKENILKEGDWNTMRIKVQGDNVQTWLNGQEMVNLNDEKIGAGKGRIALQIHDGGGIKVLWRNLNLRHYNRTKLDINQIRCFKEVFLKHLIFIIDNTLFYHCIL